MEEACAARGRCASRELRPTALVCRSDGQEWQGIDRKYRENTYMFIKERIVDVMADQRAARGLTSEREAPEPIKVAKKGRRIIEPKEEPPIELEGEEKGEWTFSERT